MSFDNTIPHECHIYENSALRPASRELTAEEPLRIVVNGELVATLMRTPGDENDLALGFLLTEGLIRGVDEVGAISFCAEGEFGTANEIRVHLISDEKIPNLRERYREVFSSCAVCGTTMIESFANGIPRFKKSAARLDARWIFQLAGTMQSEQAIFRRTGGTHAAAIAEIPVSPTGEKVLVREDIGRHNALDKVIGAAARRGVVLERSLVLLSGRMSFEMVAKSARAGISDAAGVSAPSGLGVKLARHLGMFLAGFVRGDKMTIYAGHEALRKGEQ